MSEEEERRRRKIIANSEVSAASSRGIGLLQRGHLTDAQIEAWLELDQDYLERLEGICPEAIR